MLYHCDGHFLLDGDARLLRQFQKSNIAIIGGGNLCKKMLELIFDPDFDSDRPTILGIADINSKADGMLLARRLGFPTFSDYHDFFHLAGL